MVNAASILCPRHGAGFSNGDTNFRLSDAALLLHTRSAGAATAIGKL
jgi:hypothetical protein